MSRSRKQRTSARGLRKERTREGLSMGFFVIRRIEDGMYVTPPGSARSYTRDASRARKFSTREAAQASGLCGNETIVWIGA